MPLVEKRYAEALVDIAVRNGALDSYQNELLEVADLFSTNEEFRVFLLNPEIKNEYKKSTLGKIFEKEIAGNLLNFMLLLLDKKRMNIFPGIVEEYIKLADKERNVLKMDIVSAGPLSDEQVDKIKEKYRSAYGAVDIRVNLSVDPSLLGGVKIIVGDKVIDGTVKGRLENLKDILVKK